jgi:hypothetical protein
MKYIGDTVKNRAFPCAYREKGYEPGKYRPETIFKRQVSVYKIFFGIDLFE